MRPERSATRVGTMVFIGVVLLGVIVFVIGDRDTLWRGKSGYFVEFENVGGLAAGSPVQLSGVVVGKVEDVELPEDHSIAQLRVRISVERRFAPRIRTDSLARIQTLGLLGDKYIALTSGSPGAPRVEPGGRIEAAPISDVDTLLATGGDAVDDIVATAGSLSRILARMESGEGLLGQLLAEEEGESVLANMNRTLESIDGITASIEQGRGPLGRLVRDEDLAEELQAAVESLSGSLRKVDEGDGLLPALLHDRDLRERFESMIDNLDRTTSELAGFSSQLESGDGLLPRLVGDAELADAMTAEVRELLERLNAITAKLDEGQGTAAQLLNDPQIYEAVNDILVGVDESKMLRWLVRNRQKKGIGERYEERQSGTGKIDSPSVP